MKFDLLVNSILEEKKDACYYKVKRRYKVWPSAYASGALVKCRKVGADNWGTKTEEMHMNEEERYCPLCNKREARSECSYGGKAWDKVSVKDDEWKEVGAWFYKNFDEKYECLIFLFTVQFIEIFLKKKRFVLNIFKSLFNFKYRFFI
jgi:hypothetical protein